MNTGERNTEYEIERKKEGKDDVVRAIVGRAERSDNIDMHIWLRYNGEDMPEKEMMVERKKEVKYQVVS